MNNNFVRTLLCALTYLSLVPSYAQTPPDAGALRREVETQREAPAPEPAQPLAQQPAASTESAGPTVTVESFNFSGNTLLSSDVLADKVQGYLRRPLTFGELQKAVSAVSDAYREAGWIVRAYLPMQEIKDGIVNIAVIEAVFGETRVEVEPKRVPSERLAAIVRVHQVSGAPLDASSLDRALLLINDLPGVTAAGHLAPGVRDRETDLVLKVQDDPLLSGEVIVDNAGSRSTGEERAIASAYLNSPLRRGDLFGATLLHAEGLDFAQLSASMPIGNNGWRAGAHASHLQYALVAPEFDPLDVEGTSTAFGLDATYALIRARTQVWSLSFAADSAKFDNESNDVTTTKYDVSTVDVGLNGYRFDEVGGGGVTLASVALVYGKADLGDSPNRAIDALTTRVHGNFMKVNFVASRQQNVSERVSVFGSLSGQFANNNLDSSEKFYLGGAGGVRAYPTSEAGGDEGLLATLETRVRLPLNFTAAAFYDWGRVTVNHDNDFLGAAARNGYELHGAGASLRWTSAFGLAVKGTWAHRIGDNPRATAAGTDQDGSLKKNRFWLQASMSF